jgi:hypothetical protein
MGGLPRLATFTPQMVIDAIRHGSSRPYEDRDQRRAAYEARVRGLLPPRDDESTDH